MRAKYNYASVNTSTPCTHKNMHSGNNARNTDTVQCRENNKYTTTHITEQNAKCAYLWQIR